MTPINKDPDKLCACIRTKYDALLAQCYSKDIQLVTIETIRDIERQRYYIDQGVSWTLNSLHLPQEPHMLALAFDVCPHEYLSDPTWCENGEKWDIMGKIAQDIGLIWGYTAWGKDKPHLQLVECACEY